MLHELNHQKHPSLKKLDENETVSSNQKAYIEDVNEKTDPTKNEPRSSHIAHPSIAQMDHHKLVQTHRRNFTNTESTTENDKQQDSLKQDQQQEKSKFVE